MPSATTVTKGMRGDFGWMFRLLGSLMSALAIVALVRHAFATRSLSMPLDLVMAAYNATTQLFFGWAHPYLQDALTWLGSFIGWRPTLYTHWRDIFVLVALWTAGVSWGLRRVGHSWLGTTSIGLVGAFAGAIVTSLVPLNSNVLGDQLLIAMVPVTIMAFLLAHAFDRQRVDGWLHRLLVARTALGLVVWIGMTGFITTGIATSGSPLAASAGIIALMVFSLFFSLAMISEGGPGWFRWANVQHFQSRFGLTVISSLIGAFCFFAIDAGLKLLGL